MSKEVIQMKLYNIRIGIISFEHWLYKLMLYIINFIEQWQKSRIITLST